MKRENSPFCELSVKHQKGQMWDLGIGFDYKPMPWCGKNPREEYTPRTPVLSKARGTMKRFEDHRSLGRLVRFDVKVCRFRMRPSRRQSVTKIQLPARALFRTTKGPGSTLSRGIRPQIPEDCMSLPGTITVTWILEGLLRGFYTLVTQMLVSEFTLDR